MNEPVALRYDFDGHGYLYMDAGSGSDWASRVKNCEFLYTHPQKELIQQQEQKIAELKKNLFMLQKHYDQLCEDCTCQGGHSEAYLKAKGKL